ncbi:MAG: mechanosensitive ion channel [Firmicutes bacterium]|nr:mechanosensitive ion channel [Bacillota bacterium]MCM1401307.1 mechanosensitive ion channel [Bacteroides sp.]MCM1476738.1 mechanosensitive ion channel [Bacteroides sp.]
MNLSQIPLTPSAASEPADTTSTAMNKSWSALEAVSFDDLINRIASTLVDFAIHLAVAILVFYAGKFLIKKLYTLTANILYRRKVDKSLTTFVLSLVNMVLYFILVVTVIGILGINTTSFIAIFASAGVAIGMALSGTLQNFAGGVLILLLKPYKVGDYIEAQGYAGVVKEIQIFSTIITTPDNKSIIVPNGPLSTGSINNWSREEYRRIDWTVGISYGDSVATAREVILNILDTDPRIVKAPIENGTASTTADSSDSQHNIPAPKRSIWNRIFHSRKKMLDPSAIETPTIDITALVPKINHTPQVVLSELADSSVNLSVRAWVKSPDYWATYFEVNEKIYNTLPSAGLSFPFPQMDVHFDSAVGTPEKA